MNIFEFAYKHDLTLEEWEQVIRYLAVIRFEETLKLMSLYPPRKQSETPE